MTTEPLTPCTCTIKVKRTAGLYSVTARTPHADCPIHAPKKGKA